MRFETLTPNHAASMQTHSHIYKSADCSLLLLNPTLLQATLDTLHDIRRDFASESINVRSVNVEITSRRSKNNLVLETEIVLGNLSNSGLDSESALLGEQERRAQRYLRLHPGKQQQRPQACNQG